MTPRALLSRLALGGVLLLASLPSDAEAQLGWIRNIFGRKKPAPTAPAAAPDASQAATPQSEGATAAPGGSAVAPSQAPVQQPVVDQAAALAAQQKAELEERLRFGRALDEGPRTLDNARERLRYWEQQKLVPPFSAEVQQRYSAALRDHDELRLQDSVARATSAREATVTQRLDLAQRALRANSFSDAESVADEILSQDPGNQRAINLKATAQRLEKARRVKIALYAVGAAIVALVVLVGTFYRKIFPKKDDGGGSSSAAAAPGSGRKVYIKVVDGVGRGRLVQLSGDAFRIGAAGGDDEGSRNDLIISDSLGAVSRFHCTILRKGRDYFLTDASLNGTAVNDKALARGDSVRLRDGDEFTLANVSRLKFVRT